jgi:hypothetical protein
VGTNTSGADLGNEGYGIYLEGYSDPSRGITPTSADGNVVGFNAEAGFRLNSAAVGRGHRLVNNFVGTDASNRNLGNGTDGIIVDQPLAVVGEPTRGNVVGFNAGDGIRVKDATDATIQSNFVGVAKDGSDVGNTGAGIQVMIGDQDSTSSRAIVGYAVTARTSSSDPSLPTNTPWASGGGQGNEIAFNGGGAIVLDEFSGGFGGVEEVSIRGNRAYQNGGLGIDLGEDGVTTNDNPTDGDTGENQLQNFPELEDPTTEYDPNTNTISVEQLLVSARRGLLRDRRHR